MMQTHVHVHIGRKARDRRAKDLETPEAKTIRIEKLMREIVQAKLALRSAKPAERVDIEKRLKDKEEELKRLEGTKDATSYKSLYATAEFKSNGKVYKVLAQNDPSKVKSTQLLLDIDGQKKWVPIDELRPVL